MPGYNLIVRKSTFYKVQAYCAKEETSFGKFVNGMLDKVSLIIDEEITPEQLREFMKQLHKERERQKIVKEKAKFIQDWNRDVRWYKKFRARWQFESFYDPKANSREVKKRILCRGIELWKEPFPETYLLRVHINGINPYDNSKLLRYPSTQKIVVYEDHRFVQLTEEEGNKFIKKMISEDKLHLIPHTKEIEKILNTKKLTVKMKAELSHI